MDTALISWLRDEELDRLPSSRYWNDAGEERRKAVFIEGLHDAKALHHVHERTNLREAFDAAIDFYESRLGRQIRGVCLDLGAGICWSTAMLSRKPGVMRVYAVEISRHRLLELAPIVLEQFGAAPAKVVRVLGDFCDIRLDDGSVDIVFMSQALHHTKDIRRLLAEINRVLVPGGGVIVTGEKPVTAGRYLQRAVRYNVRSAVCTLVPRRLVRGLLHKEPAQQIPPFSLSVSCLFPPNPKKGDHYYTSRQVRRLFRSAGFAVFFQPVDCPPGKIRKAACNYIAIKQ